MSCYVKTGYEIAMDFPDDMDTVWVSQVWLLRCAEVFWPEGDVDLLRELLCSEELKK